MCVTGHPIGDEIRMAVGNRLQHETTLSKNTKVHE